MSGSSPTSTPVQVSPPIYDPGHGFREAFFTQTLPQLMQQAYPTYSKSLDPGLSPTNAALIRGGQTFAAAPFSDTFQQAGSTLGGFMSPSYENPMAAVDPNRYGFDYSAQDFLPKPPSQPPSLQAAAAAMGGGGGAPWSGMGGGPPPPASSNVGRATGQSATGPLSPGPGPEVGRVPGSNESPGLDPLQPAGPFSRRPSPGTFFGEGGGGGGGGAPGGGNSGNPSVMGGEPGLQMPGGGAIPDWLKRFALAAGLDLADSAFSGNGSGGGAGGGFNFGKPAVPNLGGYSVGSYNPMPGGQGFVDYNPGSPTINIGPGMLTGSYGPMPPGPFPGPSGGGGGGGGPSGSPTQYGANDVVTGDNIPWLGNWVGPNKGKGRDYAIADMWRRGWKMGDYKPPDEIIKKWEAAGEPTTFGSKPTYGHEVNAKLRKEWQSGVGQNRPRPAPAPQPAPNTASPPTPPIYSPNLPGQPMPVDGARRATAYSQTGAPAGGK